MTEPTSASGSPAAYEARTRGVVVRVSPSYLPGQSEPEKSRWVWAYTIEIENLGDRTLKLISRRWLITDGQGRTQEVKGLGVVGEQPVLKPGESFRYTSGCPLSTPTGMMVGSYLMAPVDGESFEAEIPAFSLDLPGARATLN
jgi:ApaG protein